MYIDPGAAEFFMGKVYRTDKSTNVNIKSPTKRMRYRISDTTAVKDGPALGPDWHNNIDIKGTYLKSSKVEIEYECEFVKNS